MKKAIAIALAAAGAIFYFKRVMPMFSTGCIPTQWRISTRLWSSWRGVQKGKKADINSEEYGMKKRQEKKRAVYRTYSMQTCPLGTYMILETTWCSQVVYRFCI